MSLTKFVAISCGTTSCIWKVNVTVLCLLDSSWHSTTPPPLPKDRTVNLGPRSPTVLRRFVPGLLERFSRGTSAVGTGALCVSDEGSRSVDDILKENNKSTMKKNLQKKIISCGNKRLNFTFNLYHQCDE